MHEFSICESLVKSINSELDKLDPPAERLVSARIAVGAMRQIVPDFMREAYALMTRETPAAGSRLDIRPIPITVKCRDCGWEGELEEILFECQKCGSVAVEMVTGMELFLENLEVEQE